MGSSSLLFFLLVASSSASAAEWRDANYHVATDQQMVIRQKDGGIRFGVDLGDTYRAEMRSGPADGGVVRGVYSWTTADGRPTSVAYAKGVDGRYRTVAGGAAGLGVPLPQFPYSLYSPRGHQRRPYLPPKGDSRELLAPYGALAARDKAEERVDEDVVVVEPPKPGYLPYLRTEPDNYGEEDAVAPEEEGEEEIDYEEVIITPDEDGFGGGGDFGGVPLPPGAIPLPTQPGQPVSQSLPVAVAVAGPLGLSHATPAAAAMVGDGGVSVAFPTAEALVGPGGVAISRPLSSSVAGIGGVAIAGGQSLATAAVEGQGLVFGQEVGLVGGPPPPSDGAVEVVDADAEEADGTGEPGFVSAVAKTVRPSQQQFGSGGGLSVYPVVANYYFGGLPKGTHRQLEQHHQRQQQQQQPEHLPYRHYQYVLKWPTYDPTNAHQQQPHFVPQGQQQQQQQQLQFAPRYQQHLQQRQQHQSSHYQYQQQPDQYSPYPVTTYQRASANPFYDYLTQAQNQPRPYSSYQEPQEGKPYTASSYQDFVNNLNRH